MIYCPSCGARLESACLVCPTCGAEIDGQAFLASDEDRTSFIDDDLDFGDEIMRDPNGNSSTIMIRDDLFANRVETTLYATMDQSLEDSSPLYADRIEDAGGAGQPEDEHEGARGRKGIVAAAIVIAIIVVAAITLVIAKPWDTNVQGADASTQGDVTEIASESNDEETEGNEMETVQLTVTGSDGSTRVVDIRRHKSEQLVLLDSSTRVYSTDELARLSDAERCIAWNEIIASANGYAFKNTALANYFNDCNWYTPDPSASASAGLSSEASANVDALQSMTDDWWKHLPAE